MINHPRTRSYETTNGDVSQSKAKPGRPVGKAARPPLGLRRLSDWDCGASFDLRGRCCQLGGLAAARRNRLEATHFRLRCLVPGRSHLNSRWPTSNEAQHARRKCGDARRGQHLGRRPDATTIRPAVDPAQYADADHESPLPVVPIAQRRGEQILRPLRPASFKLKCRIQTNQRVTESTGFRPQRIRLCVWSLCSLWLCGSFLFFPLPLAASRLSSQIMSPPVNPTSSPKNPFAA